MYIVPWGLHVDHQRPRSTINAPNTRHQHTYINVPQGSSGVVAWLQSDAILGWVGEAKPRKLLRLDKVAVGAVGGIVPCARRLMQTAVAWGGGYDGESWIKDGWHDDDDERFCFIMLRSHHATYQCQPRLQPQAMQVP